MTQPVEQPVPDPREYQRRQRRLEQQATADFWKRGWEIIAGQSDDELREMLLAATEPMPPDIRAMVLKRDPRRSKLAAGTILRYLDGGAA